MAMKEVDVDLTVFLETHNREMRKNGFIIFTTLMDLMTQQECKDTLGFNLAAMDHLKQLMAQRSDVLFIDAKAKLL